jgi:hypothetical protein
VNGWWRRNVEQMAKKLTDDSTAVAKRPADSVEQPPPSTPAAPVGSAVEIARPNGAGATGTGRGPTGWIEPVGETVAETIRTVRGLLPSRFPVFLATTALLVTGLIDAPVALGAGLAFEALRRWEPDTSR